MFQVASHPTQFSTRGHRDAHHIAPCPPSSPAVQLPRQLARPQFSEVSADAIAAASPELANVPAEYIRRGLRPKAPSYVFATFSNILVLISVLLQYASRTLCHSLFSYAKCAA